MLSSPLNAPATLPFKSSKTPSTSPVVKEGGAFQEMNWLHSNSVIWSGALIVNTMLFISVYSGWRCCFHSLPIRAQPLQVHVASTAALFSHNFSVLKGSAHELSIQPVSWFGRFEKHHLSLSAAWAESLFLLAFPSRGAGYCKDRGSVDCSSRRILCFHFFSPTCFSISSTRMLSLVVVSS